MSDNFIYHSVELENVRPTYTQFDTLDAHLEFEGRALVCGSVKVTGEYRILNNGAELLGTGEFVTFDHKIGANAFFSSYNTSFSNVGLVENLVEAPRYHAMVASGSMSRDDLMNASMVAECRSPDVVVQRQLSQMKSPSDVGGGAAGTNINQHRGSAQSAFANLRPAETVRPDFVIKPLIAINNVIGANSLLNYSTSGQIKISMNLERDNVALFGEGVTANHSFELSNVRVSFVSVPELSKQLPIQMKSHLCLKSTINSALSNVSSKVPAIAESVAISFLTQNREVATQFCNTELEKLPSVSKVRYMFNDSTNKYISYELKRIPDMIYEGIKAMNKNNEKTMCRGDLLAANKSFLLGLDFSTPTDLSRQKFNVQIENDQPISPMLMFAYYSSIISL